MVFEKEFKEAILHLPIKEKDRLLLRLLKRDVPLANQLYFELVSTQTVEERRAELEEMVSERALNSAKRSKSIQHLLLQMRSLSGDITEQVKITKDKFGEISLNLLMLNNILEAVKPQSSFFQRGKVQKFAIYVVARAFKLLVLIRAMHEDYLVDFREDLEKLGKLMSQNDLLNRTANQHGLELDWLLSGEIPENIKERQDALKKQGFLK
ncbi:hypothetical protein [Fluviicola chungangensis]|uniref:Uncharacterized protein n=1 Tax=Fluviicola chungangensis TaxID=2597671 RepID=A0A556N6N3_9FLAO|nr:hypothetical protein [Fluviicola chungangensis]TSJ47733.1 hypothetical protein FO442_00985 [Fluviicola chungangensis]